MRQSIDIVKDGHVFTGYDYDLQVWVMDGLIQDCGHPEAMKAQGCCDAHKYAGQAVTGVK